MAKEKDQDEPGVWNFREVPRDAIVKAKIGAALEGVSVKAYIIGLVEAHWLDMVPTDPRRSSHGGPPRPAFSCAFS